jgi:hypothetical protein
MTPFLISPKGGKDFQIAPSPLGEGWEGGQNSI